MSHISPKIKLMAWFKLPTQIVSPIPSPLGRQTYFTVEATHGVAAADGDFVQRRQRGFIPLGVQGSVIYEVLPADLEGVVIADVGGDHLHS